MFRRVPVAVATAVDSFGAVARAAVFRVAPRHRQIGAVVATLLIPATLGLTWIADDTSANAVPSTAQVVGSCHAFVTDSERYALSDVRPPVPCDQPHQSETVAVRELTGAFATRSERFSPEERLRFANELCGDVDVRGYLGAKPRDDYHFIGILLRLPTDQEWRRGVRQYRCELTAEDGSGNLLALTEPLQDVLTRPTGAQFRRCWSDSDVEVPCAEPHRTESVNMTVSVPPERYVGPMAEMPPEQRQELETWVAPQCTSVVSEFLGEPMRSTPYLAESRITGDGRAVECGLRLPPDASPMTGTLARLSRGSE